MVHTVPMFGQVETQEPFIHNNDGIGMTVSTEMMTATASGTITVQVARISEKPLSLETEQETTRSRVMSIHQDQNDMVSVYPSPTRRQRHESQTLDDPAFGLDVRPDQRKGRISSVWDRDTTTKDNSNLLKSERIGGIAFASTTRSTGTGSQQAEVTAAENATISLTASIVPSQAPTMFSSGTPQPTRMTTTKPGTIVMDKDIHTVVVGILIALIAVLCIVLLFLILPWIRHLLRRRASTDKRKIRRRYQTVDSWLIIKVGCDLLSIGYSDYF